VLERRQQLLRRGVVPTPDQQPTELARGADVARVELERPPERSLVVGLGQPVGLGRHQTVEERLHLRRRQRAGELLDDASIAERLHRGNSLDPEPSGQRLVAVHVHLRQLDFPLARGRGRLERGGQRPAGGAPCRPEVHHH
jgi:hypothetical protein